MIKVISTTENEDKHGAHVIDLLFFLSFIEAFTPPGLASAASPA